MPLRTLGTDVGVDPGDVDVIVCWLTADGEHLDDAELEAELRAILDPAGQRTTRLRSACPECGRLPGPNLVLIGWHPCRCGGHTTTYCRPDAGGCGYEQFEPGQDPETCRDAPFGFSE